MAKKRLRKAEDEAEDEFAPPPFNEREFYSTERELAKATLVAAVWGILIAVVSTAVFVLTGSFYIGLAVGVLAALVIRPMLDRLRFITRRLETMKWLGMFFSYFMCWLAFWILLVNPPVMDLMPPQLSDRTPAYQELGGSLRLSIEVMENSGIAAMTAEIVVPGGAVDRRDDFQEATSKLHQLELNYTATGIYSYHIRVEDGNGLSAAKDGQTEIVASQPPTVELIALKDNASITVDTPIYLLAKDNALISGVHYTLDQSAEKVFLKPIKKYETYTSDGVKNNIYKIMPNASGHRWAQGAHNMTVTATDAANNSVSQSYALTII